MDPITIVQIVGAAVSLGDVVVKCISGLTTFKTKFHDAPVHVSTMIGQLHIVQIALLKLAGWNQANGHSPRYLQLAAEIGHSLDSFEVLILALDRHLNKLESPEPSNMRAKSRITFIWSEKEIVDYSSLLDRQVNALTLLLQAIQCETWKQQQTLMDREENRSIVSLARDCSTSILGLMDDTRSVASETTANISIMFDFDILILRSEIYKRAQRSHLRQAIRAQNRARDDHSMTSDEDNGTIRHIPTTENNGALDTNDGQQSILGQEAVNSDAGTANVSGHVHNEGNSTLPKPARHAFKDGTAKLVAPPSPETASAIKSPRQVSFRWNSWLKKAPRRKGSTTSPAVVEPSRNVLLVGISESGKSTLLKALHVSLNEYSLADRLSFCEIIWSNVVHGTRVVLEAMESLEISLEDQKAEYHVQTIFMQPAQCEWDDRDIWNSRDINGPLEVLGAIETLWRDGGFQNAYKRRGEYQLLDGYRYYATHAKRIISSDYVPTDEDMLRIRVKTTGITETMFPYNYLDYRVFDVGGVRSERKKWRHVFNNVSTILFTIDAECYARLLFEDETINRMQEQLTLFDSIVNSRWFTKANFLVVFTKMDFVEERLQDMPVEKVFSDYERDILLPPTESYMRYIERRFLQLIQSDEIRERLRVIRTNLVEDIKETGLQMWDILDSIERSRIT